MGAAKEFEAVGDRIGLALLLKKKTNRALVPVWRMD